MIPWGEVKSLVRSPRGPVVLLRTQKVRSKINKKPHLANWHPALQPEGEQWVGVVKSLDRPSARTGLSLTDFFRRSRISEMARPIFVMAAIS